MILVHINASAPSPRPLSICCFYCSIRALQIRRVAHAHSALVFSVGRMRYDLTLTLALVAVANSAISAGGALRIHLARLNVSDSIFDSNFVLGNTGGGAVDFAGNPP